MSTFTDYMTVASNLTRYQTMTASDPTVAQATKYFQANIGSITTPAQLVGNARIFNYVMNAFGLGNMTYAKSLIQKVLEQGTTSSTALANTLNNPNIFALAQAFNFPLYGADATKTIAATSDVVNRYVMQTLETSQGQQNPGVQLALYFQQNASKITSGYSILADQNLLTVAQTTLGISPYTSVENIDLQAKQLDKLLNYPDFQNPTKVQNFLERFAAQYDLNNPASSSGSASSAAATLFNASSSSASGLSVNLLMSMQNLKLGGL
jgi:hypothetical protein